MKLGVIILAAGQGTRMRSALPKVLHPLAGKPLIRHVVDTARTLWPAKIVVVHGQGGEQMRQQLDVEGLEWVEQAEQLGTAHAVQQAMPNLTGLDRVLVLYGDVPLIGLESLCRMIRLAEDTDSDLGLLTLRLDDPSGYGRIVRDEAGAVSRIVEQKDATPEEQAIEEINTGILLADAERLRGWLGQVSNNNSQGEYYLTDVIALAVSEGVEVQASQPDYAFEADGVNTREQLARLERIKQQQQASYLMMEGVSLADPARFDLRGTLTHGQDVQIDINVIIEGEVSLGSNVTIGANSVLRNVGVADGTTILENCVIEDAWIGPDCRIGPFARIRPGADLKGGNHIGNFVEIKNTEIGYGSKINHLSYIGDTEIGQDVNIGAGTITCNYDGANKHRTLIGDHAFIGSNTALVAPVSIGDDATIGAGSVISRDAEEGKLTLTRARQVTLEGWTRPVKAIKEKD